MLVHTHTHTHTVHRAHGLYPKLSATVSEHRGPDLLTRANDTKTKRSNFQVPKTQNVSLSLSLSLSVYIYTQHNSSQAHEPSCRGLGHKTTVDSPNCRQPLMQNHLNRGGGGGGGGRRVPVSAADTTNCTHTHTHVHTQTYTHPPTHTHRT